MILITIQYALFQFKNKHLTKNYFKKVSTRQRLRRINLLNWSYLRLERQTTRCLGMFTTLKIRTWLTALKIKEKTLVKISSDRKTTQDYI